MARKSTPISQIPLQAGAAGSATKAELDLGRSAQQAVESFVLPQSSSVAAAAELPPVPNLVSDDDQTIKDLLNKFNRPPVPPPQQPQPQQPAPTVTQPTPLHPVPARSTVDANQHPSAALDAPEKEIDVEASFLDNIVKNYSTDVELFLAFLGAYLIASLLPITSVFSRYVFAIDKIAFSDLLVRAFSAALIAYLCYALIARGERRHKGAAE